MVCRYILPVIIFMLPTCVYAQDSTKRAKLQEVEITDEKDNNFGHMYQVDGMKITAGKKSEVINVEKLTVNKATNNTRQVYAKVAGLNIFENDGSGLQLSIGGRGLDPNRTANFNVRQNGYDISADALGYPESYYTPPAEALSKIEILKGAAGLQYGTQFGGLLNFEMKQPGAKKAFTLESRQTAGSFGFFSSYNAISGTKGKLKYFAYAHYKRGDGWRPNSKFESFNGYVDLHYQVSEKSKIGLEYTHLNYIAQQPGGLNDKMFEEDPRQSNRTRNWFAVNWDLIDLEWEYRISSRTQIQTRAYGLLASRKAVGYLENYPSRTDNGGERTLLTGEFQNLTLESRILNRYTIGKQMQVILGGIRAYRGYNSNLLGKVNNGSGADFSFSDESSQVNADYSFPNLNLAAFVENIFRLTSKWSITPGIRAEYIKTQANGFYVNRVVDQAGNVIQNQKIDEQKELPRSFILLGVGSNYKLNKSMELYGNFSQNYRSVTFTDIRITTPSLEVDPNIKDEKGWSSDLGIRGNFNNLVQYDVSAFFLRYANRIGEYQYKKGNQVIRRRGNIGAAQIYGLETFAEVNILNAFKTVPQKWRASIYSNLAITQSEYTESPQKNIVGKELEYVPLINWKAGIQLGYKKLKLTYQFSHMGKQYTDATNAEDGGSSGVNGAVPTYQLMDVSISWSWKWLILEGSVNNIADAHYFTRRATGYPGPGIIPGDGRSYFLTVGCKL
ncbi:MAG: TonB-dependent receptor [Flavipsychrobacter sp.]